MAIVRLRRLRRTQSLRDLISEARLSVKNLIMPYFVIEGRDKKESVKLMPGVYRLTMNNLIEDIREVERLGIKAVLIFGVCRRKDETGSEAYSKGGIVQRAIKEIKKQIKDIVIISDVCLCGYTSHGHCGIIRAKSKEQRAKSKRENSMPYALSSMLIDNDATLEVLAKIALSHAEVGVDFVAPSAMMDGQVRTIREALDKNDFKDIGILAYSAKYASNFYGPFREALDSSPAFGDRKSYQMDYRNSDEALREIEQDIKEGADIIMVKPALSYLDIIYRAKLRFNVPIAAYNVSGEYSMVKAYCQKPACPGQRNSRQARETRAQKSEKELVLEILTSIKRAGADLIISYHAKEVASWLMANSL